MVHGVAGGQGYGWRYNIIEAGSGVAIGTDKMHMIVVVAVLGTIAAKRIQHRVIGSGNGVYNAFFYKGLQGAVNGNTVKFFARFLFNIAMRQRILLLHEKRQYFFPAIGDA